MNELVRDLMTPSPRTVEASAELDQAMRLMDRHDVRHLPVVNAEAPGDPGPLVGMLSDRDLLLATGWLSAERRRERLEPSDEGRPRRVREVMSAPSACLGPDQRVFDLALRLVTDRIGSVAVVDSGELVGIATETDLLAHFARACRESPNGAAATGTVSRTMSASPVVVRWSTALDEASEAMVSARIRHLPVVESGDVVGIVSDRDLRRAHGQGMPPETILEEIMVRDVAATTPDTSLGEATRLMLDRSVSSLPVVTERTLVGILTTTDLACYCLECFGSGAEQRG